MDDQFQSILLQEQHAKKAIDEAHQRIESEKQLLLQEQSETRDQLNTKLIEQKHQLKEDYDTKLQQLKEHHEAQLQLRKSNYLKQFQAIILDCEDELLRKVTHFHES